MGYGSRPIIEGLGWGGQRNRGRERASEREFGLAGSRLWTSPPPLGRYPRNNRLGQDGASALAAALTALTALQSLDAR
jgi:hypothetical protein